MKIAMQYISKNENIVLSLVWVSEVFDGLYCGGIILLEFIFEEIAIEM